jgi:hypothetical protein
MIGMCEFYLIVTVLSKIIDPSVAVVIPPAAAAEIPVVEAVDDEAAFFLGSASIGNANNENKKREIIECHEMRIKAMIKRTSSVK